MRIYRNRSFRSNREWIWHGIRRSSRKIPTENNRKSNRKSTRTRASSFSSSGRNNNRQRSLSMITILHCIISHVTALYHLVSVISVNSAGNLDIDGRLEIDRRDVWTATGQRASSVDTSKRRYVTPRCRNRGEEKAATKESRNGEIVRTKRPLLWRWWPRWAKFIA